MTQPTLPTPEPGATAEAIVPARRRQAVRGRPIPRLPQWRVRLAATLAVLGPGLVSGFADNDAGGITTYSLAGANFGYALLWVILASQVVLFFTQEVGARLGLATGKGLISLIRERWGVRWRSDASAGSRAGWPRASYRQASVECRPDGNRRVRPLVRRRPRSPRPMLAAAHTT